MRRMRIFYIFISFYSFVFITVLPQGNDTFLPNVSPFILLALPSRFPLSPILSPAFWGFPMLSGFYGKLRVPRPQHRLISFYCPNSCQVGGRRTCSSGGRPDNQRQFQFQFQMATWPRPPINAGEFAKYSKDPRVLVHIVLELRAAVAWNCLPVNRFLYALI